MSPEGTITAIGLAVLAVGVPLSVRASSVRRAAMVEGAAGATQRTSVERWSSIAMGLGVAILGLAAAVFALKAAVAMSAVKGM